MDEMEFCTVIKNSVNMLKNSICHKIPDPTGAFAQTVKRPFDLFGALNGKPLYIEAKYMNTAESFNLKKIEDHQISSLLEFKEAVSDSVCWVVLGVNWGRADKRVYVFSDIKELSLRRKEGKNVLKKELATLPYFKISKDLLDLSSFADN
jgi:penicillin-binding protein-related factor A (putative recombinase)